MTEKILLSPETAEKIRAVVGNERFHMGDGVKPDMSHDEKPLYGAALPDAVAEVASAEEAAEIMKICGDAGIGVTVRGAGTGLCGGSAPMCGGLVLSLAGMNRIIGLDEKNMTITAQAGSRLQDVVAAAEEKGLYYPPDPGEKTASIGGNLNTNAGGPRAVGYGTTRDYVLSLTAVLPTGEIIRLGSQSSKASVGPDLLRLVAGSEGTLAVVTEVTLRLLPKKKHDISFILPYESVACAMSAAATLKKSGMGPVCMELITGEIAAFSAAFTGEHTLPEDAGASLLVTFESDSQDWLDVLMENFAEIAEETCPKDILVVDTPTLKKSVWAAHGAFQTAVEGGVKRFDESDAAVPMTKVAEYVDAVRGYAAESDLSIQLYAHAGDGCVHVFVFNDELSHEAFDAARAAFMKSSYKKGLELGGAISGEHGIGSGKKVYLEAGLGEDVLCLMRRVKAAFDPKGILNPGKVI